MGIIAINTSSSPALLQASSPADPSRLLPQTADPVASAVSTPRPAATVPTDSFNSLYLSNVSGGETLQLSSSIPVMNDAVVLSPAILDTLPALLRGVYLAPVVSRFFFVPYRRRPSASFEEAMQDVPESDPGTPAPEYANGQPYNPNAYPMHPGTTETAAAHLRRMLHNLGMGPPGPQIVSGNYGKAMPHRLDLLA